MEFKLPLAIVSSADVARLVRELKNLDDFFIAARARTAGTSIQPPRSSPMLEQVAKDNRFNLLDGTARANLIGLLEKIQAGAPAIHISFATDPPVKSLEKILVWLRGNIHPHILVQVGLQPTIAAGCVLRTPNKIFDMSLRQYLDRKQDYLLELIRKTVNDR